MAAPATGDAPDGRDGPHLFVDDLEAPRITDDDRHHLAVLRVRAGDPITVSDGAGRWRRCPVRARRRSCRRGDASCARSVPAITVAFAPVKGDRPEWAVQKLTELGVDRIVVMETERSVVRWQGERAAAQTARLRRISREAAMQSRQCYLPEVVPPLGFAEASAAPRRVPRTPRRRAARSRLPRRARRTRRRLVRSRARRRSASRPPERERAAVGDGRSRRRCRC